MIIVETPGNHVVVLEKPVVESLKDVFSQSIVIKQVNTREGIHSLGAQMVEENHQQLSHQQVSQRKNLLSGKLNKIELKVKECHMNKT